MVFRETQIQPIITIDINEYRNRKTEKLQDMAKTFIDKVRFFQKDTELPRMSPWERRQIHLLVSEYDDIESESTGEGENRRVVLKLKKVSKKEKD
jgi:spoIIIJ-associated protein